MVPVLNLFGKSITIYQIMTLVGIFATGIFACRLAKSRGQSDDDMIVLLLFAALGVVLGMHLLYGITNLPLLAELIRVHYVKDFKTFLEAAVTVFGGSVFYGGLLGGMLSGWLYIRHKGWDLPLWADLVTPAIPLFHFFGRIGCFLGGCCYGLPCSVGFTCRYSLAPGANGVRRFPIQLVEAGCNLMLFLVLRQLLQKGKQKGKLLAVYLLSYSVIRFTLEFFRGDAIRGIWFGLSTSQWISLALFLAAGIWLLIRKRKETA